MRTKNKDAKLEIKKNAKKIFFEKQYEDASMRDVASASGMTVGNIYRYYENKSVLFDEIVGSVHDKVIKTIKINDFASKFINKIGVNEKNVYKNSKFKKDLIEYLVKLISENATEIYILLSNSKGSKYEGFSDQILELVKTTIMKMVPGINESTADVNAYTSYSTLVYILKKDIKNKQKLQEETKEFLQKFFETF